MLLVKTTRPTGHKVGSWIRGSQWLELRHGRYCRKQVLSGDDLMLSHALVDMTYAASAVLGVTLQCHRGPETSLSELLHTATIHNPHITKRKLMSMSIIARHIWCSLLKETWSCIKYIMQSISWSHVAPLYWNCYRFQLIAFETPCWIADPLYSWLNNYTTSVWLVCDAILRQLAPSYSTLQSIQQTHKQQRGAVEMTNNLQALAPLRTSSRQVPVAISPQQCVVINAQALKPSVDASRMRRASNVDLVPCGDVRNTSTSPRRDAARVTTAWTCSR